MKTLYLECNMGAAGDMLSAALLELYPDPAGMVDRLNALGIPGVSFEQESVEKCGIRGTHLKVTVCGEEEESLDVHSHTHEHHDHTDHISHDHDHSHGGDGTPMEELVALMKFMVSHNDAHAQELAELASQLQAAGKAKAYTDVMDTVADFDVVNARLDAIMKALALEL